MNHTRIWHDIMTSVQYALGERFAELSEERLIERSDSLLAMLAGIGGAQPVTTSAFLRHYDTALHHELCRGPQPFRNATTVVEHLHDLTRAVLVSGAAEGMSIEAAVSIALVLQKRGLTQFCALPSIAA